MKLLKLGSFVYYKYFVIESFEIKLIFVDVLENYVCLV